MPCAFRKLIGATFPFISCASKSRFSAAQTTFRIACAKSAFGDMETALYLLARALLAFIQALPLAWVARIGRAGGALTYWLDARHRRVALRNLTMCFGQEKSPAEIRS